MKTMLLPPAAVVAQHCGNCPTPRACSQLAHCPLYPQPRPQDLPTPPKHPR